MFAREYAAPAMLAGCGDRGRGLHLDPDRATAPGELENNLGRWGQRLTMTPTAREARAMPGGSAR